jgi:hypothetical protein
VLALAENHDAQGIADLYDPSNLGDPTIAQEVQLLNQPGSIDNVIKVLTETHENGGDSYIWPGFTTQLSSQYDASDLAAMGVTSASEYDGLQVAIFDAKTDQFLVAVHRVSSSSPVTTTTTTTAPSAPIVAQSDSNECYFSQTVASAIAGVPMGPPQPQTYTAPGSGDPSCFYKEIGGPLTFSIIPQDETDCSSTTQTVVSVPGGGCVLEVNIAGPDVVAQGDGGVIELSIFETNAPAGAYEPGMYSRLLVGAESLVTLLIQGGGQG